MISAILEPLDQKSQEALHSWLAKGECAQLLASATAVQDWYIAEAAVADFKRTEQPILGASAPNKYADANRMRIFIEVLREMTGPDFQFRKIRLESNV